MSSCFFLTQYIKTPYTDELFAGTSTIKLIHIPTSEPETENQIRDVKDHSILRATINAKADVLLTGDKDFRESGVKHPVIMTPADFLVY